MAIIREIIHGPDGKPTGIRRRVVSDSYDSKRNPPQFTTPPFSAGEIESLRNQRTTMDGKPLPPRRRSRF